jgi:hypothetical protein
MNMNPSNFNFNFQKDQYYVIIEKSNSLTIIDDSIKIIGICKDYESAKKYLTPNRIIKGPVPLLDFKFDFGPSKDIFPDIDFTLPPYKPPFNPLFIPNPNINPNSPFNISSNTPFNPSFQTDKPNIIQPLFQLDKKNSIGNNSINLFNPFS